MRSARDEKLIRAVGDAIRNAPPVPKAGDPFTYEMMLRALRGLARLPERLRKFRRAAEGRR